jgi:hypothetical protein
VTEPLRVKRQMTLGGSYVTLDMAIPVKLVKGVSPIRPCESAKPSDSKSAYQGPVAQRLEQGTHNPLVGGSNPSGPTIKITSRNSSHGHAQLHGPGAGQLHDLLNHVGVRVAGLFRRHGELRGAGEPGVRIRFDHVHFALLVQAHIDAAIVA